MDEFPLKFYRKKLIELIKQNQILKMINEAYEELQDADFQESYYIKVRIDELKSK